MNTITLVGRIIKAPELKQVGEYKVASVVLSVNRNNGKKTTEGYPESDLFNVEVWGKRGETLGQYAEKGATIGVNGRIESRKHEEKTYWTVKADNWAFVGPKQGCGQPADDNSDIGF